MHILFSFCYHSCSFMGDKSHQKKADRKEHVLKSGQQFIYLFYYKIVHAVHIQRSVSLYVYRVYNFIIKLLATFQHMLFSDKRYT